MSVKSQFDEIEALSTVNATKERISIVIEFFMKFIQNARKVFYRLPSTFEFYLEPQMLQKMKK